MGAKVYERGDDDIKAEVEKILPTCYHIKCEDIAAYRLSFKDNHYCESIVDLKTGMIAKNDLDSCSDEINRIFNQLYRLYANTFRR